MNISLDSKFQDFLQSSTKTLQHIRKIFPKPHWKNFSLKISGRLDYKGKTQSPKQFSSDKGN